MSKITKTEKSAKTEKQSDKAAAASFVTPEQTGKDPSTLPFPEWVDQEVNAEKWDAPKTKDKPKAKISKETKKGSNVSSPTVGQIPEIESKPIFEDPQIVHLPHSIKLHEWKRATEIFQDAKLVIFEEKPEYPDLISGSKHLLHSEFMRTFISTVTTLEYLGNTSPTPVEFATATYVPTTSDVPWKPWHHVYSMTKAGKGGKHNPMVNNLGKYIVRVFWMGCWRKLLVDDLLPVDKMGHVLLPSSENPKTLGRSTSETTVKKAKKIASTTTINGERKVEMWPFLLCKALLKVASLTWTERNELFDFDMVSCLTGWIVQKIDTKILQVEDIWDICKAYSDHYTWPTIESTSGTKVSARKTNGSKATKSGTIKVKNFLDSEIDLQGVVPFHLIVNCMDLRHLTNEEVPDMSPCWAHPFLLEQTRDIPLVKPDPKPELARWKRFRWLAWAIRKGIYPNDDFDNVKCIKFVSVFRKCSEHVDYEQSTSKESIDIKRSVEVIEEMALEMGDGKNTKSIDESNKSSKSSKDINKLKSKDTTTEFPPDPSIWCDFEKIGGKIETLRIYLKPSQFKTQIKITDLNQTQQTGKLTTGKKNPNETSKTIIWNTSYNESRNEPLYMFMDTLDTKFLVLNLSQPGNTDILIPPKSNELNEDDEEEIDSNLNIPFILQIIRMRRKLKSATSKEGSTTSEEESVYQKPTHAYTILETFDWQSRRNGKPFLHINTIGTKAKLIDINAGRFIFKLWLVSYTNYNLNVLSDVPIEVCHLEELLQHMSKESERLQNMVFGVSSCFGVLVQKFGTEEYLDGLRNFYKAYKPEKESVTKKEAAIIHQNFLTCFFDTVYDFFPENQLDQYILALRVLFLDTNIKYRTTKKEENILNLGSLTSEEIYILKELERHATTIQSFFRMCTIKNLKKLHNPSHPRHLTIFETLKKIYIAIFGVQSRLTTCAAILRNFLGNPGISDIRCKYSVCEDLKSVLTTQEFVGEMNANKGEWTPIFRYVFHVDSPQEVKIRVFGFCEMEKYVVRVFDNDTGEEIRRHTNNAIVESYNSNIRGYTVLSYGWCNSSKLCKWKLVVATLKCNKNFLLIPEVFIEKKILCDTYKPNPENKICLVNLSMETDELISLRLSVSYEQAKIFLKCTDSIGRLISQISGTGSVLLPVLCLESNFLPEDRNNLGSPPKTKRRSSGGKSFPVRSSRSSAGSIVARKRSSGSRSSVHSPKVGRRLSLGGRVESERVQEMSVFNVVGCVLEDSWPLTEDEWRVVDREKLWQKSGSTSTLRKSAYSRRSTEKGPTLMEKPFWCLEAVINKHSRVTLSLNQTRQNEIKLMKNQWQKGQPDRYEKGLTLRRNFLDSIAGQDLERQMLNCSTEEIAGLSTMELRQKDSSWSFRSLTKPDAFRPPNLQKYVLTPGKIDLDKRILKLPEDNPPAEETSSNDLQERFQKDMQQYITEQVCNISLLKLWFDEIRNESKVMMEQSANMMLNYVNKVKETEKQTEEAAANEKKGKKKKK